MSATLFAVSIPLDDTMADFARVWELAERWDRERPKSVELDGCRAQLYMGAMEIPIIAFRPREHVGLTEARIADLVPILSALGLELDTVEIGQNYKINRRDTKEYVGRILRDALKLHCERILNLGPETFERIVTFYLSLPRA